MRTGLILDSKNNVLYWHNYVFNSTYNKVLQISENRYRAFISTSVVRFLYDRKACSLYLHNDAVQRINNTGQCVVYDVTTTIYDVDILNKQASKPVAQAVLFTAVNL